MKSVVYDPKKNRCSFASFVARLRFKNCHRCGADFFDILQTEGKLELSRTTTRDIKYYCKKCMQEMEH